MAERSQRNRGSDHGDSQPAGDGVAVADKPADDPKEETVENKADATPPDGEDTKAESDESEGDDEVEESEDDDDESESDETKSTEIHGGTVEGVTLVHGPDEQILPEKDADGKEITPEDKPAFIDLTLGALTERAKLAIKEMEDDSSIVPGDKSNLTELTSSLDEMVTDFGAEYVLDTKAKSYVRRVTDAALEVIARFYQHVYQTRLGRLAEAVSTEMNKTDEQGRLQDAAVAKMVVRLMELSELSRLKGVPDGRLILALTGNGVIVTFVPDGLHSKRADFSGSRRGVEGATTGRRGRLPAGEGPIEWTENGQIERVSGSEALIRLYAKGSRAAKHVLETVEGWSPNDIQAAISGAKALGSQPPKTKTNRLLYAKKAIEDETHPYARVVGDEQKAA